jgi:hypothetical protein
MYSHSTPQNLFQSDKQPSESIKIKVEDDMLPSSSATTLVALKKANDDAIFGKPQVKPSKNKKNHKAHKKVLDKDAIDIINSFHQYTPISKLVAASSATLPITPETTLFAIKKILGETDTFAPVMSPIQTETKNESALEVQPLPQTPKLTLENVNALFNEVPGYKIPDFDDSQLLCLTTEEEAQENLALIPTSALNMWDKLLAHENNPKHATDTFTARTYIVGGFPRKCLLALAIKRIEKTLATESNNLDRVKLLNLQYYLKYLTIRQNGTDTAFDLDFATSHDLANLNKILELPAKKSNAAPVITLPTSADNLNIPVEIYCSPYLADSNLYTNKAIKTDAWERDFIINSFIMFKGHIFSTLKDNNNEYYNANVLASIILRTIKPVIKSIKDHLIIFRACNFQIKLNYPKTRSRRARPLEECDVLKQIEKPTNTLYLNAIPNDFVLLREFIANMPDESALFSKFDLNLHKMLLSNLNAVDANIFQQNIDKEIGRINSWVAKLICKPCDPKIRIQNFRSLYKPQIFGAMFPEFNKALDDNEIKTLFLYIAKMLMRMERMSLNHLYALFIKCTYRHLDDSNLDPKDIIDINPFFRVNFYGPAIASNADITSENTSPPKDYFNNAYLTISQLFNCNKKTHANKSTQTEDVDPTVPNNYTYIYPRTFIAVAQSRIVCSMFHQADQRYSNEPQPDNYLVPANNF